MSVILGYQTKDKIVIAGDRRVCNFDKVYDRLNDEEKRTMIQGFIKEIQIYPKEKQEKYEHPIKNITFNFPIVINGEEVDKISWEKGNTVETVALLTRKP